MSCQPGCSKHVHTPKALIRSWANRLQRNQHVVAASVGEPGSGKSEGNLFLGIDLQTLLNSGPVNIRRQVAFKPSDRKPLAQALPRFRVVFDDEATGEGGHKRRGMSNANVDNVQDLDACRGRNQANLFACPRLIDLDTLIQAHLMGYMEWHRDHSCEWFEAIRGGPQWDPYVHWESRFTVDNPPWLGDYHPETRNQYLQAKDDHMKGRRAAADEILLEDKYYSLLKTTTPTPKPRIIQEPPPQPPE